MIGRAIISQKFSMGLNGRAGSPSRPLVRTVLPHGAFGESALPLCFSDLDFKSSIFDHALVGFIVLSAGGDAFHGLEIVALYVVDGRGESRPY